MINTGQFKSHCRGNGHSSTTADFTVVRLRCRSTFGLIANSHTTDFAHKGTPPFNVADYLITYIASLQQYNRLALF